MSGKKTYYLPGIFFLFISFYTVYQIRTNSPETDYGYFMFILLIKSLISLASSGLK